MSGQVCNSPTFGAHKNNGIWNFLVILIIQHVTEVLEIVLFVVKDGTIEDMSPARRAQTIEQNYKYDKM